MLAVAPEAWVSGGQSVLFALPINTTGYKDISVEWLRKAKRVPPAFDPEDYLRLNGYVSSVIAVSRLALRTNSNEPRTGAAKNKPNSNPISKAERRKPPDKTPTSYADAIGALALPAFCVVKSVSLLSEIEIPRGLCSGEKK